MSTTWEQARELVRERYGSPVVREYGARTPDGRWIVIHGTEAELSGEAVGGYAGDGVTTVDADGTVEFHGGRELWRDAEDIGEWPDS